MALIFHMTPITPAACYDALGQRAYGVTFGRHDQVKRVLRHASAVLFDNGAFRAFTQGKPTDWPYFYAWLGPLLDGPNRWAVIPDVIDAGSQLQDALLEEWPFGDRGAPVWHTDEPIDRLLRLLDAWPRVCFGSTGEHWRVGSPEWRSRMDETWLEVLKRHPAPVIHMLRGTNVARDYPFDSADSSSLGQNSHRYRGGLFDADEAMRGLRAYADRLENIAGAGRAARCQRAAQGALRAVSEPEDHPILL